MAEAAREEGREGRFADVAAALLLGGASRRMGADKARLLVGGVPAATRTARLLARYFEEVLLVGGDPPPEAPGRRVADPEGPVCALRGLAAALGAARAERVLVVATDLPGLTPEIVLGLVAHPEADVVLPRTRSADGGRGRLQPLCAVYRREAVLAEARARLHRGELALHALLDAVSTAVLEGADLASLDPEGLALTNVNTPDELRRFAARAGLEAVLP
jgi:molybdopterin-guanine dinucleotide biosynthesis protein A